VNGTEPKIEIIKPFGEAFELMKRILFQPFQLRKWLVIGFAAFLCGHFAGGGFGFPSSFGNFRNHQSNQNFNPPNLEQWKPWLFLAIGIFALLFFVLIIVLMWIRARGNFIFNDCIVRNRAAIAVPWREYRQEGNSYFLFGIAVLFVVMLVCVGMGLILFGTFGRELNGALSATVAVLAVLFLVVWVCFALCFAVISYFMVPVMYIRRCRAIEALRVTGNLILSNPAPFILFCLFGIVLIIALMMVGGIAICATCCLAALPYVGTVILLPMFVWFRAFGLLFLRQFGPDYDVWAGISESSPPPVSPPPPPLPN
jgi:hypothetical protein